MDGNGGRFSEEPDLWKDRRSSEREEEGHLVAYLKVPCLAERQMMDGERRG